MRKVLRMGRGVKACRERVREVMGRDLEGEEFGVKVQLIQELIPLGLLHVGEMLKDEVRKLAGERYQRDGEPGHVRWSREWGSVYLGEQKVPIEYQRVRDRRRGCDVELRTYREFQKPRGCDEGVMKRLLHGLSTRNYEECCALKGLCNAPTGAIAASATTSLPEELQGSRNWDYRFSWIRDSVFTLRSLSELGYHGEADGFRRFIERSAAGSAEELQILYGVGGERRLMETTLDELAGYRDTRPVRIGNAAVNQQQFDIFGELLDLSWRWHRAGNDIDGDYWEFISGLVDRAVDLWQEPDCGLWEFRSDPRHFVLSKAMCWVAIDRAIRMAENMKRDYPKKRWQDAREAIRNRIMTEGVDSRRGVFIQAFGHPIMDASLLLLPVFDFVAFDDETMVRTTEAICEELQEDRLIRRYPSGSDGLKGGEGTFIACTFWLVECLAAQGKLDDARKYYNAAAATANDLGLFSEEFDVAGKQMLGNFPQGLTHLSHIAAIVALNHAENKKS